MSAADRQVSAAVDRICAAVADDGYAVEVDFLAQATIAALAGDARRRDVTGEFHAAGVGRGATHQRQSEARGDRVLWLEQSAAGPIQRPFWEALESLRSALNQTLLLGLFSLEAHYALYPAGASYRRHRDRFRNQAAASGGGERVISCSVYLNEDWAPADGGALRLYVGEIARDVLPIAGTLVCFLSDRFEHEVLPAARERLALTGWFRRRG